MIFFVSTLVLYSSRHWNGSNRVQEMKVQYISLIDIGWSLILAVIAIFLEIIKRVLPCKKSFQKILLKLQEDLQKKKLIS